MLWVFIVLFLAVMYFGWVTILRKGIEDLKIRESVSGTIAKDDFSDMIGTLQQGLEDFGEALSEEQKKLASKKSYVSKDQLFRFEYQQDFAIFELDKEILISPKENLKKSDDRAVGNSFVIRFEKNYDQGLQLYIDSQKEKYVFDENKESVAFGKNTYLKMVSKREEKVLRHYFLESLKGHVIHFQIPLEEGKESDDEKFILESFSWIEEQ